MGGFHSGCIGESVADAAGEGLIMVHLVFWWVRAENIHMVNERTRYIGALLHMAPPREKFGQNFLSRPFFPATPEFSVDKRRLLNPSLSAVIDGNPSQTGKALAHRHLTTCLLFGCRRPCLH